MPKTQRKFKADNLKMVKQTKDPTLIVRIFTGPVPNKFFHGTDGLLNERRKEKRIPGTRFYHV